MLGSFQGAKRWAEQSSAVTDTPLDLWDTFYRVAVRCRLEQMVSSQVSGGVYCLQSSVSTAEGRGWTMRLTWAGLCGVSWGET